MVVRTRAPRRNDPDRIDRVFHALADSTRRDIVRVVLDREESITGLAARYPMSFAAVQKHVAVLERAALISKRRSGREQLVRGNVESLRSITDLLDGYEAVWRARVEQMENVLTNDKEKTK